MTYLPHALTDDNKLEVTPQLPPPYALGVLVYYLSALLINKSATIKKAGRDKRDLQEAIGI